MRNEDELTIWGFKQFREHYDDIIDSAGREHSPLSLAGTAPKRLN